MEIEIDTAIPNSKEEDLEIETDGKDGVICQDQNPKKDINVIEIAVETGKGTTVDIGEKKERAEIENTEIETEKKERVEIEEKERAEIENTEIENMEEEKKKERKAR